MARALCACGSVALHLAWSFFLIVARVLFTFGLAGLHVATVLSTFGLAALHLALPLFFFVIGSRLLLAWLPYI